MIALMPRAATSAYRLGVTVSFIPQAETIPQFRGAAAVAHANANAVQNHVELQCSRGGRLVLPKRALRFHLMSRLIMGEPGTRAEAARKYLGIVMVPHLATNRPGVANPLVDELQDVVSTFNAQTRWHAPRLSVAASMVLERLVKVQQQCRVVHPGPYLHEQLVLHHGKSATAIAYHLIQT